MDQPVDVAALNPPPGFHPFEPERFFYGAVVSKVLAVRSRDLAGWVLPVLGGTVFSALVLIWFTSSFWFFTNVEFPGF